MSLSYAPWNLGYDSNINEVSELTEKVKGWAPPQTISATTHCRQLKEHVGKMVRMALYKTYPGLDDSTLNAIQESIDTVAHTDNGGIAKLSDFLYRYKQEKPLCGKYSGDSIATLTPDPSLQEEHFHQTHTTVMQALDTLFSEGESDEYRSNILSSSKLRAKKEKCIKRLQLYLEGECIHDWEKRPPIEQVEVIIGQVLDSKNIDDIANGVSDDIKNGRFDSALIKLAYVEENDLRKIAMNISPNNTVELANSINMNVKNNGGKAVFILDGKEISYNDKHAGILKLLTSIRQRK